jgi:hypothetical protein
VNVDASDIVAIAALALSGWAVWRTSRRERQHDEMARAAFVQVRLIRYEKEYWWRIENHGPDTAWLWALNVVNTNAPPEAEHGEGEQFNDPSPARPPLHDPRLLPRLLPSRTHVLVKADLGQTQPPYRAMVWFSDRRNDVTSLKAVSRPVAPEPPI